MDQLKEEDKNNLLLSYFYVYENLGARTFKYLYRKGYRSLKDFEDKEIQPFLEDRNFGKHSFTELQILLDNHNIDYADKEQNLPTEQLTCQFAKCTVRGEGFKFGKLYPVIHNNNEIQIIGELDGNAYIVTCRQEGNELMPIDRESNKAWFRYFYYK